MKTYHKYKWLWLVLLIAGLPLSVHAMETDDCLSCHSDRDEVGDELFIDGDQFSDTTHSEMGCVTCHESITDEHPDDGEAVSRSACVDCHDEVGEQYGHSAHADNATCTDCHNPHQARGIESMAGPDMDRQCQKCHEEAGVLESHSGWLPQANLHLAKIPCITCHTSAAGYEVLLNISQKTDKKLSSGRLSSYDDLKKYSGDKSIESLIDLNGDDHVSLAELRTFNHNPAYKQLHLAGTLVPDSVSHNITTLDNRYDCTYCHAAGPGRMQTNVLSLPQEDGSYRRVTVDEGAILDTLYGTPNLYMTGSTRNATMNIIGLIIICGGFIMPVGHGTLRFLTRKNRQHKGE
jgi:hypothetical protein